MRWAYGLLHCLHGVIGVFRFMWQRGRSIVVFTHANDINGAGEDEQMGPLLEHLRGVGYSVAEVSLVSLRGMARVRSTKPKGFVSWAAVLAPARLLASVSPLSLPRAREMMSRWLLRLWRPQAIILIDESGSGQPLVRAARGLGIASLGIQHGDFAASNPQYAPSPGADFDREPVDCLCLWSEWFQTRLLAVSPVYTVDNTFVSGRLRPASWKGPPRPVREEGPLRVLALMENDPLFATAIEPFLHVLDQAPEIHLERREHPASPKAANQRPLQEQLRATDIVLGIRSSGLWEAVAYRLPVVVPMTAISADRAALADADALVAESPEHLLQICLRLSTEGIDDQGLVAAHLRLWGQDRGAAQVAILDLLKRRFDLEEPGKNSGFKGHAG